jgi:hypothetical protein
VTGIIPNGVTHFPKFALIMLNSEIFSSNIERVTYFLYGTRYKCLEKIKKHWEWLSPMDN